MNHDALLKLLAKIHVENERLKSAADMFIFKTDEIPGDWLNLHKHMIANNERCAMIGMKLNGKCNDEILSRFRYKYFDIDAYIENYKY